MKLAGVGRREEPASLWGVVIAIVAVLAAGNQITNPFTYMLHNDALGLLVCAVAFGALVICGDTAARLAGRTGIRASHRIYGETIPGNLGDYS